MNVTLVYEDHTAGSSGREGGEDSICQSLCCRALLESCLVSFCIATKKSIVNSSTQKTEHLDYLPTPRALFIKALLVNRLLCQGSHPAGRVNQNAELGMPRCVFVLFDPLAAGSAGRVVRAQPISRLNGTCGRFCWRVKDFDGRCCSCIGSSAAITFDRWRPCRTGD